MNAATASKPRNPFTADRALAKQFDAAVQAFLTRHRDFFSADGQPHRLNGFASPFWRGYFGEPPHLIPKQTFAWACYRAGRACGRAYPEQFKRDGRIGMSGKPPFGGKH